MSTETFLESLYISQPKPDEDDLYCFSDKNAIKQRKDNAFQKTNLESLHPSLIPLLINGERLQECHHCQSDPTKHEKYWYRWRESENKPIYGCTMWGGVALVCCDKVTNFIHLEEGHKGH